MILLYPERSVAESKDLLQVDKDPSATLGISVIAEAA